MKRQASKGISKKTSTGTYKKKKQQTTVAKLAGISSNPKPKVETKSWDAETQTTTFSTTAVFAILNGVGQGTSLFQHVGRQIYMKSLQFDAIVYPTATTVVQDYGRMLIIYDKQPNKAFPAIADLLQDYNGSAGASTTSLSFINMTNRRRFVVLRDKRIQLPAVTVTAGVITNLTMLDPIRVSFNTSEFIRLGGIETEFIEGATDGNVSQITSGSLFVVFFSQAAAAGWTCSWNARLRYQD